MSNVQLEHIQVLMEQVVAHHVMQDIITQEKGISHVHDVEQTNTHRQQVKQVVKHVHRHVEISQTRNVYLTQGSVSNVRKDTRIVERHVRSVELEHIRIRIQQRVVHHVQRCSIKIKVGKRVAKHVIRIV